MTILVIFLYLVENIGQDFQVLCIFVSSINIYVDIHLMLGTYINVCVFGWSL